jgi:MarR family 2-MHQ and catechol resistance regulon transcriptional repressor
MPTPKTPPPARGRRSAGPSRAPNDALETDAAAVYDVMTEMLRIYQFRDRDRVASHGLTVTQAYALDIILRRGELTAKDLALELALEKSTVSRLIDGMVANHLVERSGHPRDARSALLCATPLGRRLYTAFRRNIVRENADALRELAPAQRATFIETLRRFTDAAKLRIRGADP